MFVSHKTYVIFRVSEAATAVEEGENEEGYKAVIARPKEKNPHYQENYSQSSSSNHHGIRGPHKSKIIYFRFVAFHLGLNLSDDFQYCLCP